MFKPQDISIVNIYKIAWRETAYIIASAYRNFPWRSKTPQQLRVTKNHLFVQILDSSQIPADL